MLCIFLIQYGGYLYLTSKHSITICYNFSSFSSIFICSSRQSCWSHQDTAYWCAWTPIKFTAPQLSSALSDGVQISWRFVASCRSIISSRFVLFHECWRTCCGYWIFLLCWWWGCWWVYPGMDCVWNDWISKDLLESDGFADAANDVSSVYSLSDWLNDVKVGFQ